MTEEPIGTVAAYDAHSHAMHVRLSRRLRVGDRIHIKGREHDIEEVVDALRVDDLRVKAAQPGQEVDVWCPAQVHRGDQVYRID